MLCCFKEKTKISCITCLGLIAFGVTDFHRKRSHLFYLYLISEVDEVGTGTTDELEEEPSASQMAGKSPNFCVLLHGSLKVEGMVALVQLG